MSVLGSAFSLFLVYNVIGNLPFYIAILKPYDPSRQKIILIREMLIALGILFLFGYAGESVLHFLGVTPGILGIAGGILLFVIALTMIFPKHTVGGLPPHEPIIVPIATPAMAGPGSISAVMLFSDTLPSFSHLALVIFLAWLPSLGILLAASYIRYLVGERGLIAFERFGGLLISLIAIQMISSGTIRLVKENFTNVPKVEAHHAVARD